MQLQIQFSLQLLKILQLYVLTAEKFNSHGVHYQTLRRLITGLPAWISAATSWPVGQTHQGWFPWHWPTVKPVAILWEVSDQPQSTTVVYLLPVVFVVGLLAALMWQLWMTVSRAWNHLHWDQAFSRFFNVASWNLRWKELRLAGQWIHSLVIQHWSNYIEKLGMGWHGVDAMIITLYLRLNIFCLILAKFCSESATSFRLGLTGVNHCSQWVVSIWPQRFILYSPHACFKFY